MYYKHTWAELLYSTILILLHIFLLPHSSYFTKFSHPCAHLKIRLTNTQNKNKTLLQYVLKPLQQSNLSNLNAFSLAASTWQLHHYMVRSPGLRRSVARGQYHQFSPDRENFCDYRLLSSLQVNFPFGSFPNFHVLCGELACCRLAYDFRYWQQSGFAVHPRSVFAFVLRPRCSICFFQILYRE